jgi:hypothetical protein
MANEEIGQDYEEEVPLDEEELQEEPVDDEAGEEPEAGASENDSDDEPKIPFTITNEDGDEIEEAYTYEQLQDIVNAYKTALPNDNDVLNKVAPFMQRINNSQLLQYIHYYQDQGMDDVSVMTQLYKDMKSKGYDEAVGGTTKGRAARDIQEEPEFDNDDQRFRYYMDQMKKELYESEVAPLKQKLEQYEGQTRQTGRMRQNESILENALKKHGWDPQGVETNKALTTKIYQQWETMYPGMDIRQMDLTQPMANNLIKLSLGYKGKNKGNKSAEVKSMLSSGKIPKIMPGTKSGGQAPQKGGKAPQLKGYTSGQRSENFSKIFND